MKLSRRYVILQRIVWLQSLFCILLAVYVLVARKKAYPLNITVNETKPLDLKFLDDITNLVHRSSFSTPQATSTPVAGVAEESRNIDIRERLPFIFESYCSISGKPFAVVGSRVIGVGDLIHGRTVDSISPLGVVVDGFFYQFSQSNKEVVHNESRIK